VSAIPNIADRQHFYNVLVEIKDSASVASVRTKKHGQSHPSRYPQPLCTALTPLSPRYLELASLLVHAVIQELQVAADAQ
jgi:hypothetical protein